MDVYSKLGACEGFLKDAASEVTPSPLNSQSSLISGSTGLQETLDQTVL